MLSNKYLTEAIPKEIAANSHRTFLSVTSDVPRIDKARRPKE